ncbi:MAG: PAC2 family protein [Dehalococcoidia bacterium]|nr:PAC2 family protein [Dehalococcoidia bacterium]
MDGFTVSEVSGLRSPVVIMAFTGWSDTGTVTTDVASHLIEAFDAERFLTVDPEDYYVFTDTRPTSASTRMACARSIGPTTRASPPGYRTTTTTS